MIKSLLLSIMLTSLAFSQVNVQTYKLSGEKSQLAKIAASDPGSNGINTILAVGDTIWVASSRGLSKTTDNGSIWTNYYGNSTFGTESVSALAYDYATHSIWAAIAHTTDVSGESLPEGSGLLFSRDGGATWTHVNQSLDASNDTIEIYGTNKLHALPVTVKIQNITYAIAITPNVVWTANFAGGLRKHRIDSLFVNPSSAWERVVLPPDDLDKISPTDTLDFCMSPVSGNYCSTGSLNYRVFALAVAEDTILYVGSADGINKTTESVKAATTNDITWTKFNHQKSGSSNITGNFIVAMEYDKYSTPKALWAATWQAEDNTEEYGVSYTTDGGTTWTNSLVDEKVHGFGFYGNSVIAPADNGAFRSNNLGDSWLLPGNIVDSGRKLTLKSNKFYAAQFDQSNANLWLGSNWGLALQKNSTTSYGSDWNIFFSSPVVQSNNESYAFPNPFSPRINTCQTAIHYSTGGASQSVTIRIFSFSMKYIRTLIQNITQSGTSINTVWDGKDDSGNIVPNGVYFYKIEMGSGDPMFGKIMVVQ
jgi:hypothetical protein